ncbi:MAG: hypothetical protein ACXVXJ_07360, partial [Mycobacteriaceae bacterium]
MRTPGGCAAGRAGIVFPTGADTEVRLLADRHRRRGLGIGAPTTLLAVSIEEIPAFRYNAA